MSYVVPKCFIQAEDDEDSYLLTNHDSFAVSSKRILEHQTAKISI